MKRAALAPMLTALALRLAVAACCDRVVADVERYERVARHLLDVSWNPYETRHLYPYPPPWAAAEAGALWLARRGVGSFAVNVKLPVLAADLLLVALLAALSRSGRASPFAPWLYAVHPVSVLVGVAHGQFDAIPLLFLLLAMEALARERRDASALALAAAIAAKSFPVLALPFLALEGRASPRSAARYALISLAPGALCLVPFLAADPEALRRELFSYGGIADFGWTGVLRGASWLATGVLPRSEARFWPAAAAASRLTFVGAWAALVYASRSGRWRLSAERWALATLLAFSTLYGLQSAQYLLWPLPLGLRRPGREAALHAVAATAGLVGFYLFLAPGVLRPGPLEEGAVRWAGSLWLAGALATLAASLAWLVAVLRDGWEKRLRAATDASERPSNSPSR